MPDEVTMASVIAHMQSIADEFYGGNVSENLVRIYHRLSDAEQECLMAAVTTIIFAGYGLTAPPHMTQPKPTPPPPPPVEEPAVKTPEWELDNIDLMNQSEMITLKTWLVKMVSVVLTVCFSGILMFMVFTSGTLFNAGATLRDIWGVVKIMFTK